MPPADRQPIETEVFPVSPYRLPRRNGSDLIVEKYGSGLRRLLVEDRAAVIVSVRPTGSGGYRFRAEPVPPERVSGPGSEELVDADPRRLEAAMDSFRFSLGIDDDMAPFRDAFIGDPLLGPAIRRQIESRPSRRADPWEALAWAVTEQLIEYRRAAAIQRRMIRRWGLSVETGRRAGARTGAMRTAVCELRPHPRPSPTPRRPSSQACDLERKARASADPLREGGLARPGRPARLR